MKKRTMMARILMVTFVIGLLFPLNNATAEAAASMKLSKSKVTLTVGKTKLLSVGNMASTSTIKWSSSDKKVATVSSKGKVTAQKAGKATITAAVTIKSGKTSKFICKVTVKAAISNTVNSIVTWEGDEYVYFGSYPQSEVTGKKLTDAIKNAKYNSDGVAKVDGISYKRIQSSDANNVLTGESYSYDWSKGGYHYFKYEPIRWKVLSKEDDKLFLLSEYILDCQNYNTIDTDVIWETCTLRSWLNDSFLKTAFSEAEGAAIINGTVGINDNPVYKTNGGNDTKDKIFLMSFEEMCKKAYGFSNDYEETDIARRASNTDFARAMGTFTYAETYPIGYTSSGKAAGWWRLRSPGETNAMTACVYESGYIYHSGDPVDYSLDGVRPALKLDLSVKSESATWEGVYRGDGMTIVITREGQPTEYFNGDIHIVIDSGNNVFFPRTPIMSSDTKIEDSTDNSKGIAAKFEFNLDGNTLHYHRLLPQQDNYEENMTLKRTDENPLTVYESYFSSASSGN